MIMINIGHKKIPRARHPGDFCCLFIAWIIMKILG